MPKWCGKTSWTSSVNLKQRLKIFDNGEAEIDIHEGLLAWEGANTIAWVDASVSHKESTVNWQGQNLHRIKDWV